MSRSIPTLLTARNRELGLADATERLTTARSADALCVALRGKSGVEQVKALAAFEPKSSGHAVMPHVGAAKAVASLLENDIVFGVFAMLQGRAADLLWTSRRRSAAPRPRVS